MQITIKRGEHPNADDVVTALANTVFYNDGAPWQPTPECVARLIEIFGASVEQSSNVVSINREGR